MLYFLKVVYYKVMESRRTYKFSYLKTCLIRKGHHLLTLETLLVENLRKKSLRTNDDQGPKFRGPSYVNNVKQSLPTDLGSGYRGDSFILSISTKFV